MAVGVVFWSRGVGRRGSEPRHDPRPAVFGLAVGRVRSGLVRAIYDFSVLDWMVVLPIAAVVSLVLTGVAYRGARQPRRSARRRPLLVCTVGDLPRLRLGRRGGG